MQICGEGDSMRPLVLALAVVLSCGVAGPARATLRGASVGLAFQFGTIQVFDLSSAASVAVNGSGGGSHLTELLIPGGVVGTTGLEAPVTDPLAFPIRGIHATAANGAGSFSGYGNDEFVGFGGVMPLVGEARFCLFSPCASSPVANLTIPLSVVGVDGSATRTGAVNITVFGAPWTTGTVAIGAVTAMGGAGPTSSTATNPSGFVNLVTPVVISTNIGVDNVIPVFAFLTVRFVPEPGTSVLIGTGIVGLATFARRRRSRR